VTLLFIWKFKKRRKNEMPTMIQRKLRCKFTGSDDFLPEDIPRDKFLPVIGYEYRRKERQFEGKTIQQEDLYYIVIDNKGKLKTIASFNCSTMIDDQSEINGSQLMQLLNNITIMGKVISEKMAKTGDQNSSKKNTEQS